MDKAVRDVTKTENPSRRKSIAINDELEPVSPNDTSSSLRRASSGQLSDNMMASPDSCNSILQSQNVESLRGSKECNEANISEAEFTDNFRPNVYDGSRNEEKSVVEFELPEDIDSLSAVWPVPSLHSVTKS